MTSDASDREPAPPRVDLWKLPRLRVVEQRLRRYREPRVTYVGTERIEHDQAFEAVVETSEPFIPRAVSPVLYVGEVEIREWEMEDATHYRFFGYELDRYERGAPIGLGWPDAGSPETETGAHFEPDDVGRRSTDG
jgi:hypothetical protein